MVKIIKSISKEFLIKENLKRGCAYLIMTMVGFYAGMMELLFSLFPDAISFPALTALCMSAFVLSFIVGVFGIFQSKGTEKQDLSQNLPCKVGDTVYAYCNEFGILPYVVDCIVINDHITYQCSSYSNPIGDCQSECLDEIEPDIADFGKTVFITQEEAEQKLLTKEKHDN